MRVLQPVDELAQLAGQSVKRFLDVMVDLGAVAIGGAERASALDSLARTLAETAGMCNILGRRRLLLEADARLGHAQPTSGLYAEIMAVPKVPFAEALASIVKTEPRLATSAEEIAELYRAPAFFAMAKSIDLKITAKVKDILAKSVKKGTQTEADLKEIVEVGVGQWTRAYAETVYRTNLGTHYTAGRLTMAKDPLIAEDFPGFIFDGPDDDDARDNHKAALGLVAKTDDPIWKGADGLAPPLGFN